MLEGAGPGCERNARSLDDGLCCCWSCWRRAFLWRSAGRCSSVVYALIKQSRRVCIETPCIGKHVGKTGEACKTPFDEFSLAESIGWARLWYQSDTSATHQQCCMPVLRVRVFLSMKHRLCMTWCNRAECETRFHNYCTVFCW